MDDNKVIDAADDLIECIETTIGARSMAYRDRPYDGQDHTINGEFGKSEVHGISMRDVCDCVAKGILESCSNEAIHDAVRNGIWMWGDLYAVESFDPIAALQNAAHNISEMMKDEAGQ